LGLIHALVEGYHTWSLSHDQAAVRPALDFSTSMANKTPSRIATQLYRPKNLTVAGMNGSICTMPFVAPPGAWRIQPSVAMAIRPFA